MPSKGVDLYAYKVDDGQKLTLKLEAPETSDCYTVSANNQIYTKHIDVKLKPFYTKGDYSFEVGSCLSRSCKINLFTGNISDSGMDNMLNNQQCLTCSEGIVSYGFYDAGFGYDDESYTSHHQNYAYIGDTHRANWMTNLTQNHQQIGEKPFSTFVLPGAHEAGMNTNEKIAEVAINAKYIKAIMTLLAAWRCHIYNITLPPIIRTLAGLSTSVIERTIVNLTISQKDTITNMLNMGIRYFDFRPGYIAKIEGHAIATGEGLYHQHNFIPGMAFSDFLDDIVNWMIIHTGEIVVVNLSCQGLYSQDMKPSAKALETAINTALDGTDIGIGDIRDAKTNYNELVALNKRLLFFNQDVNINGVNHAKKYDSYSDETYTTLKPEPIIDALNGMKFTPPSNEDYTVLQLQGAASDVKSLWPRVATFTNNSSSPLLMTKAYFDSQTYPWASAQLNLFNCHYPLVMTNNFVDPVMSHIAQSVTLVRSRNI